MVRDTATAAFVQVHQSWPAVVAACRVVVIENLIKQVRDVLLLERVLRLVVGIQVFSAGVAAAPELLALSLPLTSERALLGAVVRKLARHGLLSRRLLCLQAGHLQRLRN